MKSALLVLALGLLACSSRNARDEAIDRRAQFIDEVCACQDGACARKAGEGLAAWTRAHPPDGSQITEAQVMREREQDDRLQACTRRMVEQDVAAQAERERAAA